MEELEQKIQSVLNDPEQMAQIMSMAQSLGAVPEQPAPVSGGGREEKLLNALKPFVRPDKREKIDRAMQIAQLSKLAGMTMKRQLGERGDSGVV